MSDWTTDAANAIDNAVGLVRERTVEPVQTVVRAVIYGLIAALILIPAVTLLPSPLFRLLTIVASRSRLGGVDRVRRNLPGRRAVLLDQAQSLSRDTPTGTAAAPTRLNGHAGSHHHRIRALPA